MKEVLCVGVKALPVNPGVEVANSMDLQIVFI